MTPSDDLRPRSTEELLAALDRPIDHVLTIDYETYFDDEYTLRKMTTEAYIRDPRFETIGVGVKIDRGPSVWTDPESFKRWTRTVPWDRVAVIAHHAHFEGLISSHHYGFSPAVWFDTMSMGRALFGHGDLSLGRLAVKLGVGVKGDEVEKARGKRRHDFSPEEYARYGVYCCTDTDLERGIFDAMLERGYAYMSPALRPGFPEVELHVIDMTVRMFSEPELVLHQGELEQFHVDERKRKTDLLARVAQARGALSPLADLDTVLAAVKSSLTSDAKFAKILVDLGEIPGMKWSEKKKEHVYAFAKTDTYMKTLLDHPEDELRWLAEARVAVKSTGNESRTERLLGIARRGPLPIYLNYAKAHTYRFAGGDKVNPQNFQRKGRIRKAIKAPKRKKVVVADSGQIEARVNAWLAGHTTKLDIFRASDAKNRAFKPAFKVRARALAKANGRKLNGDEEKAIIAGLAAEGIEEGDYYSDMGTIFYGRKITKSGAPDERQNSKSMELGLGYQMAWKKFAIEMLKGLMGAKPKQFTEEDAEKAGLDIYGFFNTEWKMKKVGEIISRLSRTELEVHCAVADAFVELWRSRNEPIVQAWADMEQVAHLMLEDGADYRIGPNGCLRVVRHGIELPNGTVLRYPGLHLREKLDKHGRVMGEEFVYMGGDVGKEVKKLYGGLLVENVVQALARIIVIEQSLWISANGGDVRGTTHDEVYGLADESEAEATLDMMLHEMRRPPAWAPDIPLDADGDFADSYGECK